MLTMSTEHSEAQNPLRQMLGNARFWLAAAAITLLALVVLGAPAGIMPNPFFIRTIPTRFSDVLFLLLSAPLIGLTLATYVVRPHAAGHADRGTTRVGLGGLVAYFAIACPVCNKIVLVALGVSGALNVYAPLQPIIGVISTVLLGATLVWRLRQVQRGCVRCATTSRVVALATTD